MYVSRDFVGSWPGNHKPSDAAAPFFRLGKVLGRLPQGGGDATRLQFSRDGHLRRQKKGTQKGSS